jgi:hypothetical protein
MARKLSHAKLSFMGSSLVVATSLSSSSLSHASQGCKRSLVKMMMAEGIARSFSSIQEAQTAVPLEAKMSSWTSSTKGRREQ